MKNILFHLFYGNVNEVEKDISHLYNSQEYSKYRKAVENLEKTFNKTQQELFNEVISLYTSFNTLYLEQLYCNAVKTGMCLGLELVDFTPNKT